jgi:spore coat polysaccharide biosynthesis protein SpsF
MGDYDEQELFWASNFGDEYTDRNNETIIANKVCFEKVFQKITVNSVFEIGCNRGLNLIALNNINKNLILNGLEINEKAFNIIKQKNICTNLYNDSFFNFNVTNNKCDIVFTKGVLIHINPERLNEFYDKMYHLSNRYILIAEYYSKTPQKVEYRGNSEKLFKRDFCSEIMNRHSELKLIDYGFVYHKDPNYPLDDITWFLLEKVN